MELKNGSIRLFGFVRSSRGLGWFLAGFLCLGSGAHAFDLSGYVRAVPAAGGSPSWVKTSRITRVGGVPTVWTVGGRSAAGAINPSTMRTICRSRQACVAALGVAAAASAIGYYYWQLGQEPDFNQDLGLNECITIYQPVDGYNKPTINIPCGNGTTSSYSMSGEYQSSIPHNSSNQYGENVSHSSVAWASRVDTYEYPILKDNYTRVTGNQNSTRFRNQATVGTDGQTVEEYLDNPVEPITEEQWWNLADQTQGVTLQTGTALDGLPVLGTVTVRADTLTAEDYLTPQQITDLGLDTLTDTGVITETGTGTGTDTGTGTETGTDTSTAGGAAAVCGSSPLPPCDVTVTNWPEAPTTPDYLVADDEDLETSTVSVGTFDYGTGWLPKTCPSDLAFNTPYGSQVFSYQYVCQGASAFAPLTVLAALLAGLSIVFGLGRGSSV